MCDEERPSLGLGPFVVLVFLGCIRFAVGGACQSELAWGRGRKIRARQDARTAPIFHVGVAGEARLLSQHP